MADEYAQVGDLVHDLGSDPDTGWFIVGQGGYWDVDNACWCKDQPTDAPWTTEHFEILGPIAALMGSPPVVTHRADCPIVEAATQCACMATQLSLPPGGGDRD